MLVFAAQPEDFLSNSKKIKRETIKAEKKNYKIILRKYIYTKVWSNLAVKQIYIFNLEEKKCC